MFVVLYDGNWQRIRHENFGIWLSAEPIEEQKLVVPNFSVRGSRFERSDRSQEGSILIAASVFLLVGVILLGSIQIGYMYYTKRELQKTADLAALTGAQSLGAGDDQGCIAAKSAAEKAVAANVGGAIQAAAVPTCGVWSKDGSPKFSAADIPPDGGRLNALQVEIGAQTPALVPFLEGGEITASAQAVYDNPMAVFTVGSQLLSVTKDGLLAKILNGVGLDPDQISVLNSSGLANVSVTPSGLLKELGISTSVMTTVASPEQLASLTKVKLSSLLSATADILTKAGGDQNEAAAGGVNTLLDANASLLDETVSLLGNGAIFSIPSSDPSSALNMGVNALNLVETGLIVANGTNAINLSLNGLPPFLGGGVVQAKVRVVEPPSIGIGGVGTSANTAGIRIYLRISLPPLDGSGGQTLPALGPLLNTLGTTLDIPIIIEIGQAQGTLTKVCEAPLNKDQAAIQVVSSPLNICVGNFLNGGGDFFSTENACTSSSVTSVAPHQIFNLLGILPLQGHIVASPLGSKTDTFTLTQPPSDDSSATLSSGLGLASLNSFVVDAIASSVLDNLAGSNGTGISDGTRQQMAEDLVGASAPGRSISAVVSSMEWSADTLQQLGSQMSSNGLVGVLGGTLTTVGNVLDTVLLAPVGDLACSLSILGGINALRTCRVNGVKAFLFGSNDDALASTLGLAVALLNPVLTSLSQITQQLLDGLGINAGEADVELYSVRCGSPHLVY